MAGDLVRCRLRRWLRSPAVVQVIGDPVPATGVFDLHPLRAVLAFGASIDGLLCLSDHLAKTRHPRPQAHSRTSTRQSERTTSTDSLALRPRSAEVVSLGFDRCASRLVVSCDRFAWVTTLGFTPGSDSSSSVGSTAAELHLRRSGERRRGRRRRRSCRPVRRPPRSPPRAAPWSLFFAGPVWSVHADERRPMA